MPETKKVLPERSEGNTLLLSTIFQVWTDKPVNILCISSLPCKTRLFVISLLTCDVTAGNTAQYCTAIDQSDCTKSRIAWHNWQYYTILVGQICQTIVHFRQKLQICPQIKRNGILILNQLGGKRFGHLYPHPQVLSLFLWSIPLFGRNTNF